MTLTNREVFAIDPTDHDIPNLGVAKVHNPQDPSDWATLEWELKSFVCEGEYARGLERILDQYLSHLGQDEQPAAWVSGFFGSGKSHLMRVLEYLWRDYELPSGVSARDLTTLTDDIKDHLVELSTAGKRAGGLWSAAGTLSAGAKSMRLSFLSVIFDAAGLPQDYAPARFVIWLQTEGLYDQVRGNVEAAGAQFHKELQNLYVSPVLAQALIDAGVSFGETPAAVSTALQSQFPMVEEITDDEMLNVFEQVLALQSTTKGKLPLTLVALDEMQQYINEEGERALGVQHLVEACSSRFDSQVLVVATGQAALTSTPTLQKLTDRFSVKVGLTDTDVETVVRKVVLRKKPDAEAKIKAALDKVSGEIDQHLGGTKLEATTADAKVIVADYPLLPTRRRFWERALRAIDTAGKSGVLRTQLKIVHAAARSVADEPLGFVVGGDFVFESESSTMQQSGVLLKEVDELIRTLDDGTEAGKLKARICSLVFLIAQLPHDGGSDSGLRATAPMIADLLVEDLAADGPRLRKDVPKLLDELVGGGRVLRIGDEFRIQTEEGAEWTQDFTTRRTAIVADAAKMSQLRNDRLLAAVDTALAGLKLVQGESRTPRKFERFWNDEEPTVTSTTIPIWIRDEWNVTESKAKEAAKTAGTDSATVFVLLPKVDADTIREELGNFAAAKETVELRPEPRTDEGRQAKLSMQSRVDQCEHRLNTLFGTVVAKARVFQGGGNELTTASLRDGVESAGKHALVRLFPKFDIGDNAHWAKVVSNARDGAPDALNAVGWTKDVPANPVCKEVLARVTGAGTKGSDVQQLLGGPPYGWPKDAIDGALLTLLAAGFVRAERDGAKLGGAKELPRTQIGKATFYKEDDPPTLAETMAVRGVLTAADVPYIKGEEAAAISGLLQRLKELAAHAGGPAPLPDPPDTTQVDDLGLLAGNEQFRAVAKAAEQLNQDIKAWSIDGERRDQRANAWATLDRLLKHAAGLDAADAVQAQVDAILSGRQLLQDPDPVSPLVDQIAKALREAVQAGVESLTEAVNAARTSLAATEGWGELSADQQAEATAIAGLADPTAPDVATTDALLGALDAHPLRSYQDRVDGLRAKGAKAREYVAGILDPAPTRVKVAAPNATLRTESEVNAYVDALRDELLAHVQADETVII